MAEYESDVQEEGTSEKKELGSSEQWLNRIKNYQTEYSKWKDQRTNCDKLYAKIDRADSADREYSIFWANIEVLKPATYAKTPEPVVVPRFKDGDVLARNAADVLERSLVVSFDQNDIDGCLLEVRDEFLRYARGTGRVRLAQNADGIECVEYDFLTADDFAHECARTWKENGWVAFGAWQSREDGVERFGESFKEVPLKKRDQNSVNYDKDDKARVWEIWDKKSRKVIWVAEDFGTILDEQDPFLTLSRFFPCPKPAYGTLKPKTLIPVPEIIQYKDQIEEINEYTARIAALSEGLRMKGFYPAGAGDISEAIEAAIKNTDNNAVLIPISSVAALGNGTFKDMIVWWPVKDVGELISQLVELRRIVIEDVYQITGISDIVRGQTEASETATAQQIKSKWGSLRIQERQKELQRFARDMTRIAGEIIAENFQPQTVQEMARPQLPSLQQKQQAEAAAKMAQAAQQPLPDAIQKALELPAFEEVMQFLHDDKARGFVLDIETDSTIQPDEDAEKQRRVEFAQAIGQLFQQAAPLVLQAPMLGEFVAEVLKFVAQGFRAGRPLEGEIEKLSQQLQALAKQPKQEKPDPAMEKVKADTALAQQKQQADQQESAARLQMDREKNAAEIQLQREKLAGDLALKKESNAANAKLKAESNAQRAAAVQKNGASGKSAPMPAPAGDDVGELIQEMSTMMAGALQVMAQSSDQLSKAAAMMAQSASAPKQVIRDPQTGAVVRVEPVPVN